MNAYNNIFNVTFLYAAEFLNFYFILWFVSFVMFTFVHWADSVAAVKVIVKLFSSTRSIIAGSKRLHEITRILFRAGCSAIPQRLVALVQNLQHRRRAAPRRFRLSVSVTIYKITCSYSCADSDANEERPSTRLLIKYFVPFADCSVINYLTRSSCSDKHALLLTSMYNVPYNQPKHLKIFR